MPRHASAARFVHEGKRYAVLVFPLGQPPLPECLTPAEREVARALLDGGSNEEIARARGTSPMTVDHQITSIFRKVGVSSRAELFARLFGVAGDPR